MPSDTGASAYSELSLEERDTTLRKLLSAALGVAALGQDATLSYQLLGAVPGIAATDPPDLSPLWPDLQRVASERAGRFLLAMRLALQRGYGASPLVPDAAAGAIAEAVLRAGSEDQLWIQVNAALVRALSAGAGADRVVNAPGTADSIAARRKQVEDRNRKRDAKEQLVAKAQKDRKARSGGGGLAGLPKPLNTPVGLLATIMVVLLILRLLLLALGIV